MIIIITRIEPFPHTDWCDFISHSCKFNLCPCERYYTHNTHKSGVQNKNEKRVSVTGSCWELRSPIFQTHTHTHARTRAYTRAHTRTHSVNLTIKPFDFSTEWHCKCKVKPLQMLIRPQILDTAKLSPAKLERQRLFLFLNLPPS